MIGNMCACACACACACVRAYVCTRMVACVRAYVCTRMVAGIYFGLRLALFSLEAVFYKYGVDFIIQGHEHSYERLYPVFNQTVTQLNYVNPKAPVHIISGQAGCNEDFGVCVDVTVGPKGEAVIMHANHFSYPH